MVKVLTHDEVKAEATSHTDTVSKKVFLRYNEVPHVAQLATATFAPGTLAEEHSHKDMHEVFHVLSGHGLFKVDGKTIEAGPGHVIAIKPGEKHEVSNPASNTEPMVVTYFGVVE